MSRIILLLGMLIAAVGVVGQEFEPEPLPPDVFEVVVSIDECMDRQIEYLEFTREQAMEYGSTILLVCEIMMIPSPVPDIIAFLNVDHCRFFFDKFAAMSLVLDSGYEPWDLTQLPWVPEAICGADSGEE